jgi:hypothetical protein
VQALNGDEFLVVFVHAPTAPKTGTDLTSYEGRLFLEAGVHAVAALMFGQGPRVADPTTGYPTANPTGGDGAIGHRRYMATMAAQRSSKLRKRIAFMASLSFFISERNEERPVPRSALIVVGVCLLDHTARQ